MPDTRETFDDERLMRYLVGSLDEPETERFDELSVTDDEFADRLRIVEDDMVDAYAAGQLPSEMRAHFDSHYLTLPGKQDRVRFAKAMVLRQGHSVSEKGTGPAARTSRLFVWPLVAAASLALIVVGYLLLQRSTQLSPSTQPAASSAPPSPSTPEPRDRTPSSTPPAPALPSVAVVLMPSTRRVGEPPTVSIPRGATTVEVSLVLEGDDFQRYSVALKDVASDRVLWKGLDLKASSSGATPMVVVSIPSELLKPQHYTLDLSGVRASGRSEVITSYPFRVTLK